MVLPGEWLTGHPQARSVTIDYKYFTCTCCQLNNVSLTLPLPCCTVIATSTSYRSRATPLYKNGPSIVQLRELLRLYAEAAEPRSAGASPPGRAGSGPPFRAWGRRKKNCAKNEHRNKTKTTHLLIGHHLSSMSIFPRFFSLPRSFLWLSTKRTAHVTRVS